MRHRPALPVIVITIALAALLALAAARMAADHRGQRHVQVAAPQMTPSTPWAEDDGPPTFAVIRLRQAMDITARRFDGRIIAADLVGPTAAEAARGVELVYALRLLTSARDVLTVRLDARDGAFLEAAGHGLAKARRHHTASDPPEHHRNTRN